MAKAHINKTSGGSAGTTREGGHVVVLPTERARKSAGLAALSDAGHIARTGAAEGERVASPSPAEFVRFLTVLEKAVGHDVVERAIADSGLAAVLPWPKQPRKPAKPVGNALDRARARGAAMRAETLEHALADPHNLKPADAYGAARCSRTTLDRLARQGRVLALRAGGMRRYPDWQFGPEGHDRRLGDIMALFAAQAPELTYAQWTSPHTLLGGKRPCELAAKGRLAELHRWATRMLDDHDGQGAL